MSAWNSLYHSSSLLFLAGGLIQTQWQLPALLYSAHKQFIYTTIQFCSEHKHQSRLQLLILCSLFVSYKSLNVNRNFASLAFDSFLFVLLLCGSLEANNALTVFSQHHRRTVRRHIEAAHITKQWNYCCPHFLMVTLVPLYNNKNKQSFRCWISD